MQLLEPENKKKKKRADNNEDKLLHQQPRPCPSPSVVRWEHTYSLFLSDSRPKTNKQKERRKRPIEHLRTKPNKHSLALTGPRPTGAKVKKANRLDKERYTGRNKDNSVPAQILKQQMI